MISRMCPLGSSQYTPRPPSLVLNSPGRRLNGSAQYGKLAFLDPAEDHVELRLADQERIVLRMWGTVVVGEVERNVICDLNNQKGTKGRWLRQTEDLRQEGCRLLLVAYADNRVVQLNSHKIDATGGRPDGCSVVAKRRIVHGRLERQL